MTDFFNQSEANEFKISDIRDFLLATTMQNKSKDNARVFVSKNLNSMVEQGLLAISGSRRNKVFSKTSLFNQINLADDQYPEPIETTVPTEPKLVTDIAELEKKRSRFNAELAILIAEIDEYRSIIAQFPQAQRQVRKLHEDSTQHSVTLTGKITAITKTIELLLLEAA